MNWKTSKGLARLILQDRTQRRKVMSHLLFVSLGLMAGGLWLVDKWLMADPWRFLFWWGTCAVVTCITILFALYDILAVIREEREK